MAMIIRFDEKDIPRHSYIEANISPKEALLTVSNFTKDGLSLVTAPEVDKRTYYKTKLLPDVEVYIESDKIQLLQRLLESCYEKIHPQAFDKYIENMEKADEGYQWFKMLCEVDSLGMMFIYATIQQRKGDKSPMRKIREELNQTLEFLKSCEKQS